MPQHARRSYRPSERREDYFWLRDEVGLTRQQAAARVGVCARTAERYEASRRVT